MFIIYYVCLCVIIYLFIAIYNLQPRITFRYYAFLKSKQNINQSNFKRNE